MDCVFCKENNICETKRNLSTKLGENKMLECEKSLSKSIQFSYNCF